MRWPYGAVETAPIDERDIAAVAVRALSEASLAGADFVLTGPAALSHARQVAVIGEVLGRRLTFHELTPDEFRRETAAILIPDGDLRAARTPRQLVNYLVGRIPEVDPGFGTERALWTRAEIEQVVEGLLAKASGRADFDFDEDFQNIFP